jgi:hypothetical protein
VTEPELARRRRTATLNCCLTSRRLRQLTVALLDCPVRVKLQYAECTECGARTARSFAHLGRVHPGFIAANQRSAWNAIAHAKFKPIGYEKRREA